MGLPFSLPDLSADIALGVNMPGPNETPSRSRLTYAFELVEVLGGGGLAQSRTGRNVVVGLPLNPQQINTSEILSPEVTWLPGGVGVEESGFMPREVTIVGTTGLAPKKGWSAEGASIYSDGNTLWRELRRFFRRYAELKRDLATADKWVLAWHDFRAQDHWVVVPKAFRSPRSAADHRIHYPYEIEILAVADYDNLKPQWFDDGLLGRIKGLFGTVTAVLGMVTGAIEDATAFVSEVEAATVGAAMKAIDAVKDLRRAAAGFQAGLAHFVDAPRRLARAWREAVGDWGDRTEEQIEARPWSPADPSRSALVARYEAIRRLEDAMRTLETLPVWAPPWRQRKAATRRLRRGETLVSAAEPRDRGKSFSLTSRATPGTSWRVNDAAAEQQASRDLTDGAEAPSGETLRVRPYRVQAGDEIVGVAASELGDPDRWEEIAALNELRAPYISDLRLPSTARPGDTILLPDDTDVGAVLAAEETAPTDEQLYGVDAWLTDDGEWEVDPASGGTDIQLVRGVDCYRQGIERRAFRTLLGEDLCYPQVGIDAPIGGPNGAGPVESVALGMRRALLVDPRTAAVGMIGTREDGDAVLVVARAELVNQGGAVRFELGAP